MIFDRLSKCKMAANKHIRTGEEALKRFNAWNENAEANPLPPSLRLPVWRAAVKKDPARAVEILKKEWFTTKSIDGKLFCLSALSALEDEQILKEHIVPFNFNASPPSNAVNAGDMHVLAMGLGDNVVGRQVQWAFMKSNWDACVAKIGNPVVVDVIVRVSLGGFTDVAIVDDIDQFFKDKDTKSFDRTLETVKDKIRGRAAYKQRDAASLKEWLGANKYL